MSKQSQTEAIERSPEIEQHVGVQLGGLSAFLDPEMGWVEVRGELRPATGSQLSGDVEVVVAVHDGEGRVVGSATDFFDHGEFFGIGTIDVTVSLPVSSIAKVNVYPVRA